MIDTNQLLSIAFTLLQGFGNHLNIPSDAIPKHAGDLTKVVVGSPYSPVDLWLVSHRGDEFWIHSGAVNQYLSPDSYFRAQNLAATRKLKGAQNLSSNEVVELATNILRRFAKTGDPLKDLRLRVKRSTDKDIPFYLLTWPATEQPGHLPAAEIEIDARNGRAVSVDLWAREYLDPAFAAEVSNRVSSSDVPRTNAVQRKSQDTAQWTPTTNEVESLIPRWLKFCKSFSLAPGLQTNVAEVDWGATLRGKAPSWLPDGTLYKVQFRNGTVFQSLNGTVFGHVCADASFVGGWADKPPDYWKAFVRPFTNNWESLADTLSNLLRRQLRGSSTYLDEFKPVLYTMGSGGVSRCAVRWCEKRGLGSVSPDAIRTALWVEFDLATGEIKNLTFHDWKFVRVDQDEAK